MGAKYIFKSQLTDNDTTAMEALGTIRYENNSTYKYVKFSGTTTVAAGDNVCYVATDATNQTVDDAQTALAAGIAMAAAASGAASFGWILIEGVTGTYGNPNTSWTVPGAVGNALTSVGAAAPALAVNAAASSQIVAYVVKVGAAGTGVIACVYDA